MALKSSTVNEAMNCTCLTNTPAHEMACLLVTFSIAVVAVPLDAALTRAVGH